MSSKLTAQSSTLKALMAQQLPEKLFTLMGLHIGGDWGPLTFYKSKRGKLVWFPRSPPLAPPSSMQLAQRNRFRLAAELWPTLSDAQREQYELASRRASLCMTGYNLFVHFKTTPDDAAKTTIEHQTYTTLI